jgi:hypothetical protein
MNKNSLINVLLFVVVIILLVKLYNIYKNPEQFNTIQDDQKENARFTNYTLNGGQFVSHKLRRPYEKLCPDPLQCK